MKVSGEALGKPTSGGEHWGGCQRNHKNTNDYETNIPILLVLMFSSIRSIKRLIIDGKIATSLHTRAPYSASVSLKTSSCSIKGAK